MQLDEVEALRLTVLAWQYEPETRLQSGFSDAELASLRDGLGSEYVEKTGLVPGGVHSRSDIDFDTGEARRIRLLQFYFFEQVDLLQTASQILQQSILSRSEQPPPPSGLVTTILKALPAEAPKPLLEIVETTVVAIKSRLDELRRGRSWNIDEKYHAQLNENHATSVLQSIAVILDILLLRIREAEEHIYSETLLTWLQYMESVNYFAQFSSEMPVQHKAISKIQCTTSCITVALLDPSSVFASLAQDTSLESIPLPPPGKRDWFIDKDRIGDVHYFLFAAAETCNVPASLAILVWTLILLEIRTLATAAKETREARHVQKGIERSPYDPSGRRLSSSSTGSTQTTIYEDVLAEVMHATMVEDPVDVMLKCAEQGAKVFDQFDRVCALAKSDASIIASMQTQLLQEWVRAIRPSLGYSPELFDAQLSILSDVPHSPAFNPGTNFIGDEILRQDFLDVAASRFPYEALPFLRVCQSLARCSTSDTDGTIYITFRLQQLTSFTQEAVGGFASYHTYREDENANLVQLQDAVGMLDLQPHKLLTSGNEVTYLNLIPSQTIGEVIRDTIPLVVRWQYTYSGLALLGKWLEMHLKGTLGDALSPFESPDEVASTVMTLIATVLKTTYTNAAVKDEKQAKQLCSNIFEDLGSALDADRIIVSIIADIMEQQIQAANRSSYETLIACMDFLTLYCKIQPQQAWSILVQSSAFGAKGTRRNLPSVIAAIEVPSQDFRLLESCSRLYGAAIDLLLVISFNNEDQVQSLSDLKKGRQTASQRFNANALLAYTETMYAAFESISAWIFSNAQQKHRVVSSLASAFHKLLSYTFGTGEAYSTVTPISASLLPAANFLMQMLTQVDATSTGTGPLMPLLVSAVKDHDSKNAFASSDLSHLKPVLDLAEIIVRYEQLVGEDRTSSSLFFDLVPVLVRLPLIDSGLWTGCQSLLFTLLSGLRTSLLGHLGSTSCVSFVDSLRHASQLRLDPQLDHQMWTLLSKLVTIDQQWFAILLVTGEPPGRQQQTKVLQTQGKPVLETALDLLTSTSDPLVLDGLLRFLGEAQQNWLSVTDSIAARPDLFTHLIKYISSKDTYNTNGLAHALHNRVAAGVTDLAVIHLHRLMAQKNEKLFATFIPLLTWLANNAVEVASYNTSLHTNLKKNFANKYHGIDVVSIKRSGLLEATYGEGYFYDIHFASKFLAGDPHWSGRQSFSAEFERANINLSIVDSELVLLQSLERLCVEHGKFFSRNRDVARIMAQIARSCLMANMQVTPSENIFDSLFQTRADVAVVLVRPLAAAGYRGSDYTALLSASWDAARFRNGSYEVAITNEDLTYWRSILSVLLMSMQFRVERKLKTASVGDKAIEQIDPYNALFCEIAARIVGEGLRAVVVALQEQGQREKGAPPLSESSGVEAKDVALLLNILQTILRLPSLPQFATQLSEALVGTGTGRSALLLFSWSHVLLEDGEPVYADLAARFLASMSSLPRVAEELAVEGVLNRLLTARITQTLQAVPNGVSHLDKRPHGPLLYSAWAVGMLPLCLNLLHAVGGGVAGEVSSFLNAFPNQLNRASLALTSNPAYANEGAGMLTTKVAGEISTLSLISFVLASFRDAGASAGVDPTMIVPLDGFDAYKKALAEDVRDVVGQEYVSRKRRTVVDGERERGMQMSVKKKDGKIDGDALDTKILRDLRGALACLSVEDEGVVLEDGEKDD